MDGRMSEKGYFEKHEAEYQKHSHPNKPLSIHCGEVANFSKQLLDFYQIKDNTSYAVAEFLSYYHDLGKLEPDWSWEAKKRPPHSPKSVERLLRDRVLLESRRELTPLLYFLILKHHSKISPPRETDGLWRNSNSFCSLFSFLKAKDVRTYLSRFDFDPTKLIDIFGVFKIADALSATENKHREKVVNLMVEPANYSVDTVRSLIKSRIDENLWKKQLQISQLPPIALLRAPTGWGKTTVALLHPVNKQPSRVFILLPTITAINKYYLDLHDSFGDRVNKVFYFYDTEIKEDEEKLATLFFSKCFLAPFVITTIDQFLLSFLQCGRYHTKRVAFRNSAIILDEVHLLNPVMLKLLTYFIKSFRDSYNLNLLCMSATLPRALMEYLRKELGLLPNAILDFGEEYKKRKKRIRFDLRRDDIITSTDEVRHECEKGKRILVILNTVKKAIEFRKKLGDMEGVYLLHGRFMYCDRMDREKKLVELNKKVSPPPHILVSTQICEVSLDVSYQALYTEAAPLSAIIQRFGRVNRKFEVKAETCNAHIFLPDDAEKKSFYPYEPSDIEDCWSALETLEGPLLDNEWQLIQEFDKRMTYDKFRDELQRVTDERVNFDVWEQILQRFYCIDINEKDLKGVLEYRDSFTSLVLLHPLMIKDNNRREEMIELLSDLSEARGKTNYRGWSKIFARAKEMSVSIPVRWIGKYPTETNIFPVINVPEAQYDLELGLVSKFE